MTRQMSFENRKKMFEKFLKQTERKIETQRKKIDVLNGEKRHFEEQLKNLEEEKNQAAS